MMACDGGRDTPGDDADDTGGADIEGRTDELGPFVLDGVEYSVLLSVFSHAGAETVRRLRIVDGAGVVHHDEEFGDVATADHGLESSVHITADLLAGESGTGLLITREELPSAPLTGVTIQLFAPRGGRLVPLWAPLGWYGELRPPAREAGTGALRLADGDMLVIDAWRYHFGATVPVRLNLGCVPGAEHCVVPAPRRIVGAPDYAILDAAAELREPRGGEFITIYADPGAESGQRLPVHGDSGVELLEAAALVTIRTGATLELVLRNEHLRIRIDGHEGWIRGPEDFEAIGLPAAG